MMQPGLRVISIFLTCLSLAACTFGPSNKPHILILGIEQLGVEDVSCSHEHKLRPRSGFEILCQDAIRYTHAYTTSLQARAAFASLLTGLYPYQHKVRDNNSTFLSAGLTTLPEIAWQKNYSTALFAGGPAISRSSGLQQGFELFDDNVTYSIKNFFRPLNQNIQEYFSWRKKQRRPTFAVIHVPDLLFKNRATVNEMGEARNLSFESQLEELDSHLFELLSHLKKNKEFDDTYIVLAGLNSDEKEYSPLSKHSHVALLIKPFQKPRDEGIAWTFDNNITLADVGATFFELLEAPLEQTSSQLPAVSLQNSFENKENDKFLNRWILTESSWTKTNGYGDFIFSLRKDQFHLTKTNKLQIYNTLIDKMESATLIPTEPAAQALFQEVEPILQLVGSPEPVKSEPVSDEIIRMMSFDLWLDEKKHDLLISELWSVLKKPQPFPIGQWLTIELINGGRWKDLHRFAVEEKNSNLAAVAELQLGQKKKIAFTDACLRVISASKKSVERNCHDKKVLLLADYLHAEQSVETDSQTKEILKRRLRQQWSDFVFIYHVHKFNVAIGMRWSKPIAELNNWMNFLLALQHPDANKIRILLNKEIPLG
jgi:hypothetical protein